MTEEKQMKSREFVCLSELDMTVRAIEVSVRGNVTHFNAHDALGLLSITYHWLFHYLFSYSTSPGSR